MAIKERDLSLDYLKGIGCFMVPIAHMLYDPTKVDSTVIFIDHLAEFVAVIFLAVAGATAFLQVQKEGSLKSIVYKYLLFAILGLSFNCLLPQLLFKFFVLEIFQIIALGTIFIAVFERYLKPKLHIYLLIGFGIGLSKQLIDKYVGKGVLPEFLIPADGIYDGNIILKFTGFTIIPWLSIFPLGVFAYRCKNYINLILVAVLTAVLLGLYYFLGDQRIFAKWDMTAGCFLANTIFLFGIFFIARGFASIVKSNGNFLSNLGKDSLVMMYVHMPAVLISYGITQTFKTLNIDVLGNQYAAWVIVLTITYIFILVVRVIPYTKRLESIKNWYVLAALTVLIPIILGGLMLFIAIPPLYAPLTVIMWLSELVIGIIFAKNYRYLAAHFKKA